MSRLFENRKERKKFSGKCGDRFGRLVLTGITYTKMIHGHWVRYVEAVCDCGEVKDLLFHLLASGETQSCGCYRKEVSRKNRLTHGLTNHPLYDVWNKMIERCYKPTDKSYKNYGGRGIEVWSDWKNSFVDFYNWCIANGYKENAGLSLDRRDNDGNYAPYNCWFTDKPTQNRNRRNNIIISAFGEEKCLTDWADDERCPLTYWGLRNRYDRGSYTDMEKMITEPLVEGKVRSRRSKSNVNLTAFGETKCLTDWAKDERCVVGFDRLRDRIAWGWENLKAITTIQEDSKEIKLTAFGETKSMTNWLNDERCLVKRDAMRDRYRAGWEHELILTTPPKTGKTASAFLNKNG